MSNIGAVSVGLFLVIILNLEHNAICRHYRNHMRDGREIGRMEKYTCDTFIR